MVDPTQFLPSILLACAINRFLYLSHLRLSLSLRRLSLFERILICRDILTFDVT